MLPRRLLARFRLAQAANVKRAVPIRLSGSLVVQVARGALRRRGGVWRQPAPLTLLMAFLANLETWDEHVAGTPALRRTRVAGVALEHPVGTMGEAAVQKPSLRHRR